MEYRVVFTTLYGQKSKRMDAANPLQAVNRVVREWEDLQQIDRIEVIIDTEAGERSQPADFKASKVVQKIEVNVQK